MSKKDFIISTTNTIEGYTIERYIGVISERIVVGAGLFSEFFAGLTDIFGDRSFKFEDRIEELHETAMSGLQKKAIAGGANAIIGVTVDIDEISGKNMMMFMGTAMGTAIYIRKNELLLNTTNEEGSNDTFYGEDIRQMILIKKLNEKFKKSDLNISAFYEIIDESIKNEVLIPVDLIVNAIFIFDSYDYVDSFSEKLIEYLKMFDTIKLNEELNKYIIKSKYKNRLFNFIYSELVEVDYKYISNILDKLDVEILHCTIFKILLKFKNLYNLEDVDYINIIIEKIDRIYNNEIAERFKGPLSSGWICTCGNKNQETINNCKTCGRGKNGFTSEESLQIKDLIEHLNNIKAVLKQ